MKKTHYYQFGSILRAKFYQGFINLVALSLLLATFQNAKAFPGVTGTQPAISKSVAPSPAKMVAKMEAQKLLFTENRGQVADDKGNPRQDILFTTHSGNTSVYLTATGIHYQFVRTTYPDGYTTDHRAVKDEEKQAELEKQIKTETYRFSLTLAGANPDPVIRREGKNILTENFYLPQCSNGITNVATYERVVYENVYPNIDWIVYSNGSHLKYDFLVHPGGDAAQIKLAVNDAQHVRITAEGELLMKTTLGEVREQAPVSYADGKKITTSFRHNNDGTIGFNVTGVPGQELRIDPSVSWATYYGGALIEGAYLAISPRCVTDANGNIYLMGSTSSTSGIAFSSGYQTSFSGGTYDAFLVKFNAAGARIWATYYGGTLVEGFFCAAVDSRGNIYAGGATSSTTGIATTGAFQTTSASTTNNGMLVKFDSTGARQWGTYYSAGTGLNNNRVEACALDTAGNIFIVGETASPSGLSSTGAYQATNTMGTDGYIAKFNSSGSRIWGTYYGGTGQDFPYGCATDISGNIYIAMQSTAATANLVSTGAYQTAFGGGTADVVLAKFNGTGSRLWSTYYGGSGNDQPTSCATDASGNVYITGLTASTNGIATSGAPQTTNGGGNDAFIAKFDSTGTSLVWGTYYGGALADQGNGIAVDASGNVLVAGTTSSTSGIYSSGFQTANAGGSDAMVVKLNTSGALQWASYFGGSGAETAGGVAVSGGNVYVSGTTASSTGIASPGAYQTTIGGTADDFLMKLADVIPVTITTGTVTGSPFCAGRTVSVPYTTTGIINAGNIFTAQLSDASGSFASAVNIGTLTSTAAGTITATIPAATAAGIGYRIRVIGSDPADTGTMNGTDLTIYAAVPGVTVRDSICITQLPYTWHGKIVTIGGTAAAKDTLSNIHGCDSIVTLNLKINSGTDHLVANYTTANTTGALTSNVINTSAVDAGGNIWVGTSGVPGLAELSSTGTWTNYTSSNSGYTGGAVHAIKIDATGNRWVVSNTTTAPGLYELTANGTTWNSFTPSNSGFPAGKAMFSLYIDRADNKWMGGAGTTDGVYKFNGTTWVNYNSSITPNFPFGTIFGIFQDKAGNMWVAASTGGTTGGVAKFDGTTWTRYTTSNGLAGLNAYSFAQDDSGKIWIGTNGGVSVYDGTTMTVAYTMASTGGGLAGNNIFAVAIDAAGNKWFGAAGAGLSKFDGTGWTTFSTTNTPGFGNNLVQYVTLDTHGNKWVSTFGGLTELSPSCITCTPAATTVNDTICASQLPFTWNGKILTAGGTAVAKDTVVLTGGCDSIVTLNLVVKPQPAQPSVFTTSTATVCQGQNSIVYTVPNDATVTYNWNYSGAGATVVPTGNSATISYSSTATSGTLSVTATANNGCGISAAQTRAVTVKQKPAPPSAFTASSPIVCQGQTNVVYTIPNDTLAVYSWTYSGTGTTINGTGNSVTVDFSNTAISGIISVLATANNGCGSSGAQGTTVTVQPLPAQPSAFTTSSATVCQGQNSVVYTVPNDATVTYTWSYSGAGATIVPTGNNATVTFSSTATSGTLSVTATAVNGCGTSTARTLAITVNPLPAQPAAFTAPVVTVCQGQNNVIYTVPNDATVTYTWSYSGAGATITPTGNSASVSFSSTATSGTLSVTATAVNGCGISIAQTQAITVNPLPAQPAAFTTSTPNVCAGQNNIIYTVPNDAVVNYTWSYSGAGATITPTGNSASVSFSSTATSGTLSVTATAINGCGISAPQTLAVTVNPLPNVIISQPTQPVCNNTSTIAVTFSGAVSPATYNWTTTRPAAGTLASGSGDIPSFTAVNTGTVAVIDTIKVTPVANGCIGTTQVATITVKPTPSLTVTPTLQTKCSGTATTAVAFTPTVAGTTYTWTNTMPVIGIAATGVTATIAATTVTNTTANPDTAIITITPTANLCAGATKYDTIIVNPLPPLTVSPGISVCPGSQATLTASGATTYSWSPATTPATGAIVTTTPAVTTTYSVTGTTNGCSATATTTVTIIPVYTGLAITPATPSICNGSGVLLTAGPVNALSQSFNATPVGWTSTFTGGSGAQWTLRGYGFPTDGTVVHSADGTSFYEADGTSGGNGAKNDILTSPVFSLAGLSAATFSYYNWYDYSSYDTYIGVEISTNGTTWTTIYNPPNGGYGGIKTLSLVTVSLNAYVGQANVQVRFRYTSNFGYAWAIDNVNITGTPLVTWSPATAAFTDATMTTPYAGAASNTVYVAPANTGNTPTTVTYTAAIGTCNTTAQAVVTVNPTPAVVVTPATQTVCANTATTAIAENPTVTGTTYTWTNTFPAIGTAPSGPGTVNSFPAVNNSNIPDTATITVTPIANGCTGTAQKAIIIVNPTPAATITPGTITVCNNTSTNISLGSNIATGTSYSWTNSNSSIGLAPSGTSNPLSFTATNSGNTPISATITVVPTANGCPGLPKTAVINVTPSPVVTATPAIQSVCNGALTTPVTFTSTQPSTNYAWTNNNTPPIGLAPSGSISIPAFTAINNVITPDTAIVMVTPTSGTCVGAPAPVTIIINPSPTVVASPTMQAVCNGGTVSPVTFTSTVAGNTFTWTNNNTTTGLSATGTTNIGGFAGTNTGNTPDTSIITITAAANACTSLPQKDTIIVYPTPGVSSSQRTISVCNATPASIIFSSNVSGATYSWTNTLTANGLAASGIGNVGFTAVNTNATPNTAVITVTPSAYGCSGLPQYDTIVVRPTPSASIVAAASPLFCPSDSVVIRANTGTGLTYQWQYNNTNITGATLDSFKANPAGNYTAVVTNMYNCPTVSNAVAVTHLPSPVPLITPSGTTVFCLGDSVLLNANVVPGITYFWKHNGTYISAATTPSYVATVSGNYTVYESDGTCSATSPVQVVTANQLPPAIITVAGPAFFCNGSSITLHTDSGTTGNYTYQYQLNGANIATGNTQNYTTSTIGNYTVRVTSSANCSSTSSVFPVAYLPQPTAVITSAGPITICSSDSVSIRANAGTGLSYQWLENGAYIPGATAISTFARTAGTYAVKVTGGNGCADTSAPITIAVTPSPTASATAAGSTSVCAPATVLINANTGSGYTYQWQQNGNSIAGATNNSYNATATGNYSVKVSNGACSVSSSSVQVNVSALPVDTLTVYAPRVICSGSTLLMQAALNASYTYQWQFNGTAIPQATSAFYNATNAGTYTAIVTSAAGCSVTTVPVQASTATSPTPVIVYSGSQLCAQGYTNYQWYFDGLPMVGETNPCVNITRGGGYTVTVTNSIGCSGTSPVFSLFTGVGSVTPQEVRLYPNPATTVVNISAPQSVNATLSSVDGKQLMFIEDARTIDISHLANAVYLIKIYDKNMTLIKVEKLVKTGW